TREALDTARADAQQARADAVALRSQLEIEKDQARTRNGRRAVEAEARFSRMRMKIVECEARSERLNEEKQQLIGELTTITADREAERNDLTSHYVSERDAHSRTQAQLRGLTKMKGEIEHK